MFEPLFLNYEEVAEMLDKMIRAAPRRLHRAQIGTNLYFCLDGKRLGPSLKVFRGIGDVPLPGETEEDLRLRCVGMVAQMTVDWGIPLYGAWEHQPDPALEAAIDVYHKTAIAWARRFFNERELADFLKVFGEEEEKGDG